MATFESVTLNSTVDKNLDNAGYKVWLPLTISGSIGSGSFALSEKYCPHFKTEEEARTYLLQCKDKNASADSAAVWNATLTTANK